MVDNDRGQSLISKYVWVIETIYRKQKISFKDLNELWLRDDISRGVDISYGKDGHWIESDNNFRNQVTVLRGITARGKRGEISQNKKSYRECGSDVPIKCVSSLTPKLLRMCAVQLK